MKRPLIHQIVCRRKVLETGLLGAGVLALGAAQLPSFANATSSAGESNILIDALRSIGKDVCIAAADKLESAQTADPTFSLHLLNAELHVSDAEILAKALMKFSSDNGQMLRSFSVSYNPMLGDKGTIVLAQSLPQTVSEIGFVGCEIGDVGGKALVKWARQASRLGMICVENNTFSEETKALFRELSNEKAGLLVVV
jgi:hypothetical protein